MHYLGFIDHRPECMAACMERLSSPAACQHKRMASGSTAQLIRLGHLQRPPDLFWPKSWLI
jgi:hypothetical protein